MFRQVLRFFASLRLAVVIIAALAVLISIGTFVESRFDAWTAKNLIYNSPWMYATLGLLVASLLAVIADRWPWKPRHAPFILAHVGIIIIIYGSLLTQLYGVDGTLRLPRSGEAVRDIVLQETVLNVYRSRTGENYELVTSLDVNFLKKPIQDDKPFLIRAKDLNFELLESIPYGQAEVQIENAPEGPSGSALRYQLSNANVSEVDWLLQRNPFERAEKQVGPVLLSLGGLWQRTPEINEIRFFENEQKTLSYALYSKENLQPYQQGTLKEGDLVRTKWMGLELKALRYFKKAIQKYDIKRLEYPTPTTRPALRARYNGHESYLILNDYIKVFTEKWVYLIAYQNKKIPLGFDISLRNFQKTDYPGSKKAQSYQSEVSYDNGVQALISMNEPLKYKDYYLYQASFEETPMGLASASILSVNRDPGRPWKYFGSLVMCLGVILLFYYRKTKSSDKTQSVSI
ncbi:cytochrome c biogenesis protein ResB [Bdellovibrio sp. HCB2-146]|uniref:cytochrome c biogenesis protein ResB n=1 Tax=Bdellovibrio sp. HCB2-146 TaxID=3394362 RepID=UPI0039BD74A5